MAPHPRATIAIPTYNGEQYLDDLLNACLGQEVEFGFELLVVDSGSSDRTLAIVRSHPEVRLHQIKQKEFGHGRTRNLAASLARGEIVVYLTQDAVPAGPRWLEEMLRPFEISKRVVCVFGKQVPRPDCPPTVKRDVMAVFSSFGPDHCLSLQQASPRITDQAALDALAFMSNVNSAVRKSLLRRIPFPDVAYAEDQALGREVISAGLIKCYAPLASVVHSHGLALPAYFRRMYEEMAGLRAATGRSLETSTLGHARIVAGETVRDWRFILRDPAYRRRAKLKWVLQAPLYQLARRTAVRLSTRDALPGWAARLLGA